MRRKTRQGNDLRNIDNTQENQPSAKELTRTAAQTWLQQLTVAGHWRYFLRLSFPETTTDFHKARRILNIYFREMQSAPRIQQGIKAIGVLVSGENHMHAHCLVDLSRESHLLTPQEYTRRKQVLLNFSSWWNRPSLITEIHAELTDNLESAISYVTYSRNYRQSEHNGESLSEFYTFGAKRIMSHLRKLDHLGGDVAWWRKRAERATREDIEQDQQHIEQEQQPVYKRSLGPPPDTGDRIWYRVKQEVIK